MVGGGGNVLPPPQHLLLLLLLLLFVERSMPTTGFWACLYIFSFRTDRSGEKNQQQKKIK